MLTFKRVLIATICGFGCGLICMALATSNPEPAYELRNVIKWDIVLIRTLTGFMIGVSALRMAWWLHGIVLGFIGSIPMAIAVSERELMLVVGTFVMGIIYGLLIELITSVIFKARGVGMKPAVIKVKAQSTPPPAPQV